MHQPANPAVTGAAFEALADGLSACADELHLRIMQAIRRNPPTTALQEAHTAPSTPAALSDLAPVAPAAPAPVSAALPTSTAPGSPANDKLALGISHGAAQALFENEVALRQRANYLYVDAVVLAASGLQVPAHALLDLVALARRRIRDASVLKDLIGITADMLSLAAALAAGKPEHLPGVVDSIQARYARLQQGSAG